MVYKFILLSDEVDNFLREIEIDSSASFLDFHNIISESLGYDNKQLASFFLCNDDWEKEQEITLMEMDSSSDVDSYIMEETSLESMVEDEGQRLVYVFDYLTERMLFIELREIFPSKSLDKPVCTKSKGKAPAQVIDFDDFSSPKAGKGGKEFSTDEDFYGDEDFDMDELDEEGFGDLNIDDMDDSIL